MISSIHKAARILEALDRAGSSGLSLSEIAGQTSLHPPTARKILLTLCELDYVRQNPDSRRYGLGQVVRRLGQKVFLRDQLLRLANPLLRELRDRTDESVCLVFLEGGRRCVTAAFESRQDLRIVIPLEDDTAFYESASGRLLLAFLPPTERGQQRTKLGWPGRRWPGVFTDLQFARELDNTRSKRLALCEDNDKHTVSIAVPVSTQTGYPTIALELKYPIFRDSGARQHELISQLSKTAVRMEKRFKQYSDDPIPRPEAQN